MNKKKIGIQIAIILLGILVGWIVAGRYAALIILAVAVLIFGMDFYEERKRKKKLASLCLEIDRILHNDYSIMISDYNEGELSILQSEIHKMTIRLKEQAEDLKKDKTYLMDAMADISHQLKTPLTSVNLILSLLMKEDLPFDRRLELIGKLDQSMRHIEWLIATLLKMSKFDADTVEFVSKPVSVADVVRKSYESIAIAMDLKEQQFVTEIEDTAEFNGDFAWTVEALENVLKNCMEHTPEQGTIRIKAQSNPVYTLIQVSDTGTGMDKKDIPHIFERFYRGSHADSKSVGIGLALAQMVIRRQNGVISVANNKDCGVTFTIKFYKSVT